MAGFQKGQVAALATHVDRDDDGTALFSGSSGLILSLFGLDRLVFRHNDNLLTVQVFHESKAEKVGHT